MGLLRSRFFHRLLLLAVVIGRECTGFWRPRRPPQDPRRILIAHHLLLGDTLLLTPLLAKLRQRYPFAEITLLLPPQFLSLYAAKPYAVQALPYDPKCLPDLLRLLPTSGYDLAIVPGDNRYGWLARALASRWIVAFAGDRPQSKNWAIDSLKPFPDAPMSWGDMVATLVEGEPPAPYNSIDWPIPACTPFALPEKPYALLHVGASTPLKYWEGEKWLQVAAWLASKGIEPLWSAGPGEEKLVTAVDPERLYKSFAGRLDLPQLYHLVKNARLLLCPDTSLAHLGRIVGTPTVVLFGPGSASLHGGGAFWENAPYRAVTYDHFPCRDQTVLFRRQVPWVRRCGRSLQQCALPLCMRALDTQSIILTIKTLIFS